MSKEYGDYHGDEDEIEADELEHLGEQEYRSEHKYDYEYKYDHSVDDRQEYLKKHDPNNTECHAWILDLEDDDDDLF